MTPFQMALEISQNSTALRILGKGISLLSAFNHIKITYIKRYVFNIITIQGMSNGYVSSIIYYACQSNISLGYTVLVIFSSFLAGYSIEPTIILIDLTYFSVISVFIK